MPMSGSKKRRHERMTLRQWYLLGISVFLMMVTTSMRIALHLSEAQALISRKEATFESALPSELSRQLEISRFLPTMYAPVDELTTLVEPNDFIYEFKRRRWDSAPIVMESHKLIFFTIPKVACTTFKQLFRRMMGFDNWRSQDPALYLPHNPKENGLKYLWNYSIEEANHMMTSPEYTRAIFVREPKARFLSAFLDKGMGNFGDFIRIKCCPKTRDCVEQAQTSEGFLDLITHCADPHWDPQALRMEPKFWPFINYVGHFEKLHEDGPALLKKVGAWDEYGHGWGRNGNATLFYSSASEQSHTTGSSGKVWQWLTPRLERKIEDYYKADYKHSLFKFEVKNLTQDFWIKGSDKIFARGPWDGAPVVVEKYKLIFFTTPRIGAMVWKQALRRMEGFANWDDSTNRGLPHDPATNGLKYLYDYSADKAEAMIKDRSWTKAIFVKHPKDRLLDIYTHMAMHPSDLRKQCCPDSGGCESHAESLLQFVVLATKCESDQWQPQINRMEDRYWEFVNFIGHMESAQDDAKELLERIGAWEDIGASGWGVDGKGSIFTPGHDEEVPAFDPASISITPMANRMLESFYRSDLKDERFRYGRQSSYSVNKTLV